MPLPRKHRVLRESRSSLPRLWRCWIRVGCIDLVDDGERPRFTVQVMDDNVSRTVIIDGWTGSMLDVVPPDPDGRRGR